jgi:hypothetical protein
MIPNTIPRPWSRFSLQEINSRPANRFWGKTRRDKRWPWWIPQASFFQGDRACLIHTHVPHTEAQTYRGAYAHARTHTHFTHAHTHTHKPTNPLHSHISQPTHYTHTHTHTHTHTFFSLSKQTHTRAHTHTHTHTHKHTLSVSLTHTHLHTHTRTPTHTHISFSLLLLLLPCPYPKTAAKQFIYSVLCVMAVDGTYFERQTLLVAGSRVPAFFLPSVGPHSYPGSFRHEHNCMCLWKLNHTKSPELKKILSIRYSLYENGWMDDKDG